MGHFAHHWHGYLLHFFIDRFLCRQREKPTALERASTYCLLALARYGGNTADRSRIETLREVVAVEWNGIRWLNVALFSSELLATVKWSRE